MYASPEYGSNIIYALIATGNLQLQAVTGGMIPLSEVKDETFASGMLGQGIAIKPVVGKVIAPFECPGQCSVRSPQNV